MSDSREHYKRQAGEYAATLIESGMVVGLGVGSTAIHALRRLAELLAAGTLRKIVAVPCSVGVEIEARLLGIPLTTLDDQPEIDLTIDGADEVSPTGDLIKGGGGALLREKIVAQASRREVIVIDENKLSPALGTRCVVPMEVLSFGWHANLRYLEKLGAKVTLRRADQGAIFYTDQGGVILDGNFGPIADPSALAARLAERAGIVEHGLFVGLATDLIIAGPSGVRHEKIR